MIALCEGKCGKTVTEAGKWCPSCFFDEPAPAFFKEPSVPIRTSQDLQSIRFEIHSASFHLCFGKESERGPALDKLISLVHVLQQETHINKQTKKED